MSSRADDAAPLIDGFDELAPVGRGPHGTVWAATDLAFGRRVALKVLDGATAQERLDRAMVAAGRLTDVPGVVQAYRSTATDDGRPVLVMTLLAGSLVDRGGDGGPDHLPQLVRWLHQTAYALDAAHQLGVVHRGIRAENILISDGGDAFLSDFDLSETYESDADDDRLALASTFFTAMTGRPPFGSPSDDHHEAVRPRQRPTVPIRPPGMGPELHAVWTRALSTLPADRYRTATQLAAAVGAASLAERTVEPASSDGSEHGSEPPAALDNARQRRPTRRALTMLAAGVAAVVLVAIAALQLQGPDTDESSSDEEPRTTSTSTSSPDPTSDRALLNRPAASISVGSSQACALVAPSSGACWGMNLWLASSDPADPTDRSGFDPVPALLLTPQLSSVEISSDWTGGENVCATTSTGGVMCRGFRIADMPMSQSIDSNRTDLLFPVAGVSGAQQVAVGSDHACALTGATVMCWGSNAVGQLGNSTTQDSLTPVPVTGLDDVASLVANGQQSCALRKDASVWCWGLARPPIGIKADPQRIDGLPPVVQLSTGGTHTCAIDETGGLWCWGDLDNLLGVSGAEPFSPPMQVATPQPLRRVSAGRSSLCGAGVDGSVWCWPQGEPTPQQVEGISGAQAVAHEDAISCALLTNGKVTCWGLVTSDSSTGEGDPVFVSGLGT